MAVSGHRRTISGATPLISWSSSTPMRMLKTSQKLEHIIISLNAIHQCAQFHTNVYEDGLAISAPPKGHVNMTSNLGEEDLEMSWNFGADSRRHRHMAPNLREQALYFIN